MKLAIEQDAEVVERSLGSQAGLQALQVVRALAIEAKGMEEATEYGFHDLTARSNPATQLGRPPFARLRSLGWCDHRRTVGLLPMDEIRAAGESGVGEVGAVGR